MTDPQSLRRGVFPAAGIPYDLADPEQGMRHPRLSGNECPYLAPSRGSCSKCGWIDPAAYEPDAPAGSDEGAVPEKER
jgi:hypothetical protein